MLALEDRLTPAAPTLVATSIQWVAPHHAIVQGFVQDEVPSQVVIQAGNSRVATQSDGSFTLDVTTPSVIQIYAFDNEGFSAETSIVEQPATNISDSATTLEGNKTPKEAPPPVLRNVKLDYVDGYWVVTGQVDAAIPIGVAIRINSNAIPSLDGQSFEVGADGSFRIVLDFDQNQEGGFITITAEGPGGVKSQPVLLLPE